MLSNQYQLHTDIKPISMHTSKGTLYCFSDAIFSILTIYTFIQQKFLFSLDTTVVESWRLHRCLFHFFFQLFSRFEDLYSKLWEKKRCEKYKNIFSSYIVFKTVSEEQNIMGLRICHFLVFLFRTLIIFILLSGQCQ